MLDQLCISNGITLYEKTDASVKTYAFATAPEDTSIKNFYINNFDILKKIKRQFDFEINQENALDKVACIFHANNVILEEERSESIKFKNTKKEADIFTKYLKIGEEHFILSNTAMNIIKYIAHGMSVKEIATVMEISNRTVEKHLENLMKKMNINSKFCLAKAFWDFNGEK